MERRFDMTDFEQSLRDHADQFIMVPSKRVWHGIYNNLHPGSRWPSITVALILLITLISIGHLNNTPKQVANNSTLSNQSKDNTEKQTRGQISTLGSNINSGNKSVLLKGQSAIIDKPEGIKSVISDFVGKDVFSWNTMKSNYNSSERIAGSSTKLYSKETHPSGIIKKSLTRNIVLEQNKTNSNGRKINSTNNSTENNAIIQQSLEKSTAISNNENLKSYINKISLSTNESPAVIINNDLLNNFSEMFALDPLQLLSANIEENEPPKMEMNNDASLNNETNKQKHKPAHIHKKRNAKINWVYYVTPTVGTVFFGGKAIQPNVNQNLSPLIVQSNQGEKNRLYNARLGYEVGAQMTYAFYKKWEFLTGANLSYSGYNVISNQVHPTFAYLMLRDENTGRSYAKSYITHYGNGQGQNQISLSNTNLQMAIPIGLQYALWTNNNIRINLASSLEPSIVLKSNAYIISADGRNYVSDQSLLRDFNLSGNFGSYVTFSSKKIKWQLGPNIRYQLYSTYQNNYPVKEHLIDYGIRIGISR